MEIATNANRGAGITMPYALSVNIFIRGGAAERTVQLGKYKNMLQTPRSLFIVNILN